MFTIGHLGDRVDLRYYLSAGMVGTGVFVSLFGMAYFWDVHDVWYFYRVQIAAGLLSSTGWPSVVAIVGNWFGKSKRGLIMGVWNAHTSVGNIMGSMVAAAVLSWGWGYSFLIPGALMIFTGILMFLFLTVQPEDVQLGVRGGVGRGSWRLPAPAPSFHIPNPYPYPPSLSLLGDVLRLAPSHIAPLSAPPPPPLPRPACASGQRQGRLCG